MSNPSDGDDLAVQPSSPSSPTPSLMTSRRTLFLKGSLLGGAALGVGSFLSTSCLPTSVAGRAEAAQAASSPAGLTPGAIALERPLELSEIPTPALLLDVAAFERNLKKMAAHAKDAGVGLRPHCKTHKCPIIAKRQLELGAVGVSAAKISEAETLAAAGVEKILITSPVATQDKIDRVVRLAKEVNDLILVVDHPSSVDKLSRAATKASQVIQVLVGLDTGTRRTGVALGEPALQLVRHVVGSAGLTFLGLQAYAGHVMHIKGFEARQKASRSALTECLKTRQLVEEAGFEVEIFSGGGTGTFDIDSEIDGMTDLQVGSYCFMDVQYRQIGDAQGEIFDAFEPSLHVLVSAISQPVPELITVDAGFKAFAFEPSAKPEFVDHADLIYHYGGDEHGIVQFKGEGRALELGQKARLLVSHCDPTVNLYDVIHPVVDGKVSELWPIAARGKSQ